MGCETLTAAPFFFFFGRESAVEVSFRIIEVQVSSLALNTEQYDTNLKRKNVNIK